MDMSTSYTIKAKVSGQDAIGGLNKGLGKLKTTTNNNVTAMNKLRTAASNAIGALKALAPAIGVAAMGKFVSDTLTAGDRLEKFSQSTGVAVPLLDKMRKASELAGTDFKTLVKTFPMLANNINLAAQGNKKLSGAFDDLGISVLNSDGTLRATDAVLLDVADEFAKMKDGVDKASFAYDLFGGKTGEQLIPLLNGGRKSIEGLGTAMTEHGVKRMAAFNDSITAIQHIFQDLFVVLTDALLPVLEKFVGAITFLVEKFVGLPAPVQAVIGSLGILVPLVITIVPLLGAMAFSIKAIAAVKLGAMFTAAVPAITGLAAAFAPFLIKGAIVVGIIALGKLIGTVAGHLWVAKDRIGEGIAAIGEFFNTWKENVVMTMQSIGNALKEPFSNLTEFVSNALSPLTDFIGGVFNGAMEMARNAFNKLPNIVQQAIKMATAPLRGFINFLQKILGLLGKVRKAKSNPPKVPSSVSSSTSGSTSGSTSSPTANLPRTSGYPETDMSVGNVGSRNALPSGGVSVAQKTSSRKAPNVNIQTGNVVQMDGANWVTTSDLQKAVQSATQQTVNYIQAGGVTHYL